jgi:hypothetical protein
MEKVLKFASIFSKLADNTLGLGQSETTPTGNVKALAEQLKAKLENLPWEAHAGWSEQAAIPVLENIISGQLPTSNDLQSALNDIRTNYRSNTLIREMENIKNFF